MIEAEIFSFSPIGPAVFVQDFGQNGLGRQFSYDHNSLTGGLKFVLGVCEKMVCHMESTSDIIIY